MSLAVGDVSWIDLLQHHGSVYNDKPSDRRPWLQMCRANSVLWTSVLTATAATAAWVPQGLPLRYRDVDTLWLQFELVNLWVLSLWDVTPALCASGTATAADKRAAVQCSDFLRTALARGLSWAAACNSSGSDGAAADAAAPAVPDLFGRFWEVASSAQRPAAADASGGAGAGDDDLVALLLRSRFEDWRWSAVAFASIVTAFQAVAVVDGAPLVPQQHSLVGHSVASQFKRRVAGRGIAMRPEAPVTRTTVEVLVKREMVKVRDVTSVCVVWVAAYHA